MFSVGFSTILYCSVEKSCATNIGEGSTTSHLEFFIVCMYVCMYVCMVIIHSKGKDQPGKVANRARGQLNRENKYFPVPVRS